MKIHTMFQLSTMDKEPLIMNGHKVATFGFLEIMQTKYINDFVKLIKTH